MRRRPGQEKKVVEARYGRKNVFWSPEVSNLDGTAAQILVQFGGPEGGSLERHLAKEKLLASPYPWGVQAVTWLNAQEAAGHRIETVDCKRINIHPMGTRRFYSSSYRMYVAYYYSAWPPNSTVGRHVPWTEDRGWVVPSPTEIQEGAYLSQGSWKLVMQGDGNLCLYENHSAIWSSGTGGMGAAPYKLCIQEDGNVVVYGAGVAIWNTQTMGQAEGPFFLALQHDRNVVLFDTGGRVLWNTGTHI